MYTMKTYTIEYFWVLKKKENRVIRDNLDDTEEAYAKWNKPNTERHILYDLTYI